MSLRAVSLAAAIALVAACAGPPRFANRPRAEAAPARCPRREPHRPPSGSARLDDLREDEEIVLPSYDAAFARAVDRAEQDFVRNLFDSPRAAVEALRREGAPLKLARRFEGARWYGLDQAAFDAWCAGRDPDGTRCAGLRDVFRELDIYVQMSVSRLEGYVLEQQRFVALAASRAASMADARKALGASLDERDLVFVGNPIAAHKRIDALVAASLALDAAVHAVIADGKSPELMELVADGATRSLPLRVALSADDARAYVAALPAELREIGAGITGWQERAMGRIEYETKGKVTLSALLTALEPDSPSEWAARMRSGRASASCDAGTEPNLVSVEGVGSLSPSASLRRALDGMAAIRGGDPRAAFDAARDLAPPGGPLREAIARAVALLD